MTHRFCPACGVPAAPSAAFCPACGAPQTAPPPPSPRPVSSLPLLLGVAALVLVGAGLAALVLVPRLAERAAVADVSEPPPAPEMLPPAAELPAAAGVPQHGALAVGAEGAWGVSWDAPDPASARDRALAECAPGRDCRVVLYLAGPVCGAHARGRTTFGNALASTRREAEHVAVETCARGGARSCSVAVWVCNGRP